MPNFSAHSKTGPLRGTEERRAFLEQHSENLRFCMLTIALTNTAIKCLLKEHKVKPSANLTASLEGVVEISMAIESLDEERPFLQKEIFNYLFLRLYINFETFFTNLCIRAFADLKEPDPQRATRELLKNLSWDGKFCSVLQKLNIGLKRNATKSWMRAEMPTLTSDGQRLDDPAKVLDKFRIVRNRIVHLNAIGEDGNRLQANQELIAFFSPFLVELTEFVDQAFAEACGWERAPITFDRLTEDDSDHGGSR